MLPCVLEQAADHAQVYEQGVKKESYPIDGKAYYLFGKETSAVDIALVDNSASRQHAALMHHEDGKTYLIDLQSVRICSVPSHA